MTNRLSPQDRVRTLVFAKRLKAILNDKGWTASQLADKIWGRRRNAKGALVAVGRDRISVWINALSLPSPENLIKLAKALSVPVSELMPDAEFKTALRAKPSGSVVRLDDSTGQTFLQIERYVSWEAALEILAIIKRDTETRKTT